MTYEEAITKSGEGSLICAICLQENTPLISMPVKKDQVTKMLAYLRFEKNIFLHLPHLLWKFNKDIKLGQPNDPFVWKKQYIKKILI